MERLQLSSPPSTAIVLIKNININYFIFLWFIVVRSTNGITGRSKNSSRKHVGLTDPAIVPFPGAHVGSWLERAACRTMVEPTRLERRAALPTCSVLPWASSPSPFCPSSVARRSWEFGAVIQRWCSYTEMFTIYYVIYIERNNGETGFGRIVTFSCIITIKCDKIFFINTREILKDLSKYNCYLGEV